MCIISYFIVNNGNIVTQTEALPSSLEEGTYLIKKCERAQFSYGCHAVYEIINTHGNPDVYQVGDYSLKRYETCGCAENYRLSIYYSYQATELVHTLHVDARFGEYLNTPVHYGSEWNVSNPTLTAFDFMKDVGEMGHRARIQIDDLKRDRFNLERKLEMVKYESNTRLSICRGATSVIIPNDVKILNGNQFEGCDEIKSIIIPNTVAMIVISAFNHLDKLKEVIIHANRVISLVAPAPFLGLFGENKMNTKTQFYVPSIMLNQYKEASCWKDHSDQLFAIEEN